MSYTRTAYSKTLFSARLISGSWRGAANWPQRRGGARVGRCGGRFARRPAVRPYAQRSRAAAGRLPDATLAGAAAASAASLRRVLQVRCSCCALIFPAVALALGTAAHYTQRIHLNTFALFSTPTLAARCSPS